MNDIIIIILGLVIGSVMNVVIHRLPLQASLVQPGSHCPVCGQSLRIIDLIPVLSFILLRGRCHFCRSRISIRYPLVELLTAFAFEMVYLKWSLSVVSVVGWLLTTVLVIAAFTDIEEGIIPDLVTYPSMLIGLGLSFYTIGIGSALLGMILFAGLLLAAALLSRGGMGGGDVKLGGVAGAFLGVQGAIQSLVIESLTGGLWALSLLVQGKANHKTAVKFGPFLAAAVWLVWMYGSEMAAFYLRWLM